MTVIRARQAVLQVEDIDEELLTQLREDQTVWDLSDIQRALGLRDRASMQLLHRTGRNYWVHGETMWPPSGRVLREEIVPAVADPPCLVWWPPHPAILPPPDYRDPGRPRWKAGTINTWAMHTGRMTFDGQPVTLSGRGPEPKPLRPATLDPADIDFPRILRLRADRTLWDFDDVRAFFGGATAAMHWYRACRLLATGGLRHWPFTPAETRKAKPGNLKRTVRWWPPIDIALPPPDKITDKGQYRWYRGTIITWGMQTGRIGLDGQTTRTPKRRAR